MDRVRVLIGCAVSENVVSMNGVLEESVVSECVVFVVSCCYHISLEVNHGLIQA